MLRPFFKRKIMREGCKTCYGYRKFELIMDCKNQDQLLQSKMLVLGKNHFLMCI